MAEPMTVSELAAATFVGVKGSCFPRWAKSEPSALKADERVRVSRRKSRRWNLPLPR